VDVRPGRAAFQHRHSLVGLPNVPSGPVLPQSHAASVVEALAEAELSMWTLVPSEGRLVDHTAHRFFFEILPCLEQAGPRRGRRN